MVRTSLIHSPKARMPLFLFLPHFDVICDLSSVSQGKMESIVLNIHCMHIQDTCNLTQPCNESIQIVRLCNEKN